MQEIKETYSQLMEEENREQTRTALRVLCGICGAACEKDAAQQ